MRFSGRAGGVPWYLDRPSALYGLPARCLAYDLNGTALALHRGPLDLQVGEGLRLDRNPRRVAALERRSVLSTPALLMKRFAFFVREILISPTNPSSRNRALSHLVVDVREVMRLAKKVSYGTQ